MVCPLAGSPGAHGAVQQRRVAPEHVQTRAPGLRYDSMRIWSHLIIAGLVPLVGAEDAG